MPFSVYQALTIFYPFSSRNRNVVVIGLFQIQMRILFSFLLTKTIHRFLLILRTRSFFTLLYLEGTYARLVYTWYKNIFYMIAALIVYLAEKYKNRNQMTTISKRDSDDTEMRQCNCQRRNSNKQLTHKITILEQEIEKTGTRQ